MSHGDTDHHSMEVENTTRHPMAMPWFGSGLVISSPGTPSPILRVARLRRSPEVTYPDTLTNPTGS